MSRPELLADFAGPVEYAIVEFPQGTPVAAGFELLADQVAAGTIEILDVEFVGHGVGGAGRKIEGDGLPESDRETLAGLLDYESNLLDQEDFDVIASEIDPDSIACVIVYEERALIPTFEAWSAGGAKLVFAGGIDESTLVATITEDAE